MPEEYVHQVVSMSYEAFVSTLLDEHDVTLTSVISRLESYGVETRGDLRVYWPADSYVPLDRISERVGRIIEKLFLDERLEFSTATTRHIDGATLELDSPRRGLSRRYASLAAGNRPRRTPYVEDREFLCMVYAATPRDSKVWLGQAVLGTKVIYSEASWGEYVEQDRSRSSDSI